MNQVPVAIVGGGLAGLNAARQLEKLGVEYVLLEGQDRLGGRIRTELVDGFSLDVGFQVLLTSYPEAMAALDYEALRLGRFQSGALIRYAGGFHRLADPWREPRFVFATAASPVARLSDKFRLARRRWRTAGLTDDDCLSQPEQTTDQRLRTEGYSARVIESFFRPFFSGVFLEQPLATSSRKFEYLFRLFARGQAALPAGGMERIVDQLASTLPSSRLRLGAKVSRVHPGQVIMESGQRIAAQRILIAADPWNAPRLLGDGIRDPQVPPAHAVTVFYYAASRPPVADPVLVLNGTGQGPINSLCVPSQVTAGYAPAGKSLVSVTVLGLAASRSPDSTVAGGESAVRNQLLEWYGAEVATWRFLQACEIPQALPAQSRIDWTATQPRFLDRGDGILQCGDAHDIASIQGALRSGREAGAYLAKLIV